MKYKIICEYMLRLTNKRTLINLETKQNLSLSLNQQFTEKIDDKF